jgi:hypothetical protein
MKRHLQIVFIFLLVAASFSFFEARFLPEGLTRYVQFGFALVALVVSVPFAFPKREGFVLPLQLLVFAILLSMAISWVSWGQGPVDSLKATVPFILWIFVFYLMKIKIPVRTIENIVLIYAGVYVVLYLFQFVNSHVVYFGWNTSFSTDRGIKRIIFPGGGIFFLGAFIALNRFTEKGANKYLWGPLVLLGLVIPVMQVTRQLIAATLFIYVLHFVRNMDIIKKTAILLMLGGSLFFIANSDLSIVRGLKKAQTEVAVQGEEYIRVKAAKFYAGEFSPGTINRVLGNGVSYGEKSEYGKAVTKIENTRDYYLADIGLVAVYVMFGVLALLAFALIWVKSFIIPVPPDFMYLKYYLWFLLMTGFTSYSVYHTNYLIASVFTLYIFQRIYIKEKYYDTMLGYLKNYFRKKEMALNS